VISLKRTGVCSRYDFSLPSDDDRDVPVDVDDRRRGVFPNVLRKVLLRRDEGLHVALHWVCLMCPNRQIVLRTSSSLVFQSLRLSRMRRSSSLAVVQIESDVANTLPPVRLSPTLICSTSLFLTGSIRYKKLIASQLTFSPFQYFVMNSLLPSSAIAE